LRKPGTGEKGSWPEIPVRGGKTDFAYVPVIQGTLKMEKSVSAKLTSSYQPKSWKSSPRQRRKGPSYASPAIDWWTRTSPLIRWMVRCAENVPAGNG
jgi:hypothetical protein